MTNTNIKTWCLAAALIAAAPAVAIAAPSESSAVASAAQTAAACTGTVVDSEVEALTGVSVKVDG
ncbi:MAG: hypothetical protein K2M54_12450, partial [Muribaculaceae bacterium]|nr:hypothetical protein [Muribaculaceae bacterium]